MYTWNGKLQLAKGHICYTKEEESANSEIEFEIGSLMIMNSVLSFFSSVEIFCKKVNMYISNSWYELANLKNCFLKGCST